ncbi:hypothetical protein BJ742DRAFT_866317 [Cladochytrium replicatum]|nr:hypothetical protein BJ742DRAFT_866317 [Cladochytrium replicatum]
MRNRAGSKKENIVSHHSSEIKPVLHNKQEGIPASDDEVSDLYKVLNAPVTDHRRTANQVPAIDPFYMQRMMKGKRLDDTKIGEIDATEEETLLIPSDSPTGADLATFNYVIQTNGKVGRVDEAQEAFDMIVQSGVTPDLRSYSYLMNAYASAGDLESCHRVFKSLRLAARSDPNLKLDIVVYGTLIKAQVKSGELEKAFKTYEQLKKLSKPKVGGSLKDSTFDPALRPNISIFTSLIKGCIKAGDLHRAWRTFDHMRSEVSIPDTYLYSLMIRACAYTKDAERALDLFREMTQERQLAPTSITFNSLIHACASRTDYYLECFNLFDQMTRIEGFRPTTRTFNVLLLAAARNGDIRRARSIWNELLTKSSEAYVFEESVYDDALPDTGPDITSVGIMLECFAKAISLYSSREKSLDLAQSNDGQTLSNDGSLARPEGNNRSSREINMKKTDSDDYTSNEEKSGERVVLEPRTSTEIISVDHAGEAGFPFFTSSCIDTQTLRREADSLWSTALRLVPISESKHEMSRLYLSYLGVLCSADRNRTQLRKALALFNSHSEYGVELNGRMWTVILKAITRDKLMTSKHGRQLWNDFLGWDKIMERDTLSGKWAVEHDEAKKEADPAASNEADSSTADGIETALEARHDAGAASSTFQTEADEINHDVVSWNNPSPDPIERERIRTAQGRGRQDIFRAFTAMVQGLTRIDDLDGSLDLIELGQSFREPGYLPRFTFRDVWALVEKCGDQAEMGNKRYAKRLLALCPTPPAGRLAKLLSETVSSPGPGRNVGFGLNPGSGLAPVDVVTGVGAELVLDEIDRLLRAQGPGSPSLRWWGWDAIGVPEKGRAAVVAKLKDRRKKQYQLRLMADKKKRLAPGRKSWLEVQDMLKKKKEVDDSSIDL